LGRDKPFGHKTEKHLPQSADTCDVLGAKLLKPQLLSGLQPPENDVGPYPLIGVVACRLRRHVCCHAFLQIDRATFAHGPRNAQEAPEAPDSFRTEMIKSKISYENNHAY